MRFPLVCVFLVLPEDYLSVMYRLRDKLFEYLSAEFLQADTPRSRDSRQVAVRLLADAGAKILERKTHRSDSIVNGLSFFESDRR
jgi:hypothetical protein